MWQPSASQFCWLFSLHLMYSCKHCAIVTPNAAYYRFTQQSLPACKPVLTPTWVSFLMLPDLTHNSFIILHCTLIIMDLRMLLIPSAGYFYFPFNGNYFRSCWVSCPSYFPQCKCSLTLLFNCFSFIYLDT